jgi:hypothetical protein
MGDQYGICDTLCAGKRLLVIGNGCLETPASFGCAQFSGRPVGPFQVIVSRPGQPIVEIRFRAGHTSPPLPKEIADKLQDWLNELWYGE